MTRRDTIVALASGRGKAGVAVLRLSGPAAETALRALAGGAPPPGKAELKTFCDSAGAAIDRGLALFFAGPKSFTGEDVVEFHVHGGPAVIAAMTAALLAVDGVRPAEPGEFSRRAFERGKLDLVEAEGLLDLVNAETEAQRRQALAQLGGDLSARYEGWRRALIDALAWFEAVIDFPDEETPPIVPRAVWDDLIRLRDAMRAHLADDGRGEAVRRGVQVAIVGAPNAGKSSILNALAGREAAIVSETPGTTRDVIEVRLDLGGFLVVLADTAGLRESGDAIEREGVRRALARARDADLVLEIVDSVAPVAVGDPSDRRWIVWNKCDIAPSRRGFCVSARTGQGLGALTEKLADFAARSAEGAGAPLTRARHRRGVEEAMGGLDAALAMRDGEDELVAEEIRLAARALGRIAGRVDVEDVLDRLFGEFCIGK